MKHSFSTKHVVSFSTPAFVVIVFFCVKNTEHPCKNNLLQRRSSTIIESEIERPYSIVVLPNKIFILISVRNRKLYKCIDMRVKHNSNDEKPDLSASSR